MSFDVAPLSVALDAAIVRHIDAKTKPKGSLGRLEALGAHVARVQATLTPRLETCRLLLFAGDHGIAAAGVSAYPQDVTRQMVANFLAGGAAASVLARENGVNLTVVDAGVAGEALGDPRLIDRRQGAGTANSVAGPAMTTAALRSAMQAGRALARNTDGLFDGVCDAVAFGDMGIGNTSAAALVGAKILGQPVTTLIGPGTGVDGAALARKHAVLADAAARTPESLAPEVAMAEYGGFEMAMMAGAVIGAAEAGKIILVDGFIATASALAAVGMCPAVRDYLVFAHRSAEPGHDRLLEALGGKPLLDLEMRLGEGTGAILAWPLLRSAATMVREMASFEDAGVSGPAG